LLGWCRLSFLRYELLLVLFQFVLALQLFFERFGDLCQLSRLHVGFELLQVVGNMVLDWQ
jgi:hypothetical protein